MDKMEYCVRVFIAGSWNGTVSATYSQEKAHFALIEFGRLLAKLQRGDKEIAGASLEVRPVKEK